MTDKKCKQCLRTLAVTEFAQRHRTCKNCVAANVRHIRSSDRGNRLIDEGLTAAQCRPLVEDTSIKLDTRYGQFLIAYIRDYVGASTLSHAVHVETQFGRIDVIHGSFQLVQVINELSYTRTAISHCYSGCTANPWEHLAVWYGHTMPSHIANFLESTNVRIIHPNIAR